LSQFVKNNDIIARQVAGETILVPVRGDLAAMQRIFALDAVGEYIWQLLHDPVDLQQLVEAITERFEVTAEQARSDARQFLTELNDAGLISIVSSS